MQKEMHNAMEPHNALEFHNALERSEEDTSEIQPRTTRVSRLPLEKKKTTTQKKTSKE